MVKRFSSGFTLVEVLITLAILTMVLTLSYQSLSVFMKAASKNRSHFEKAQNETLFRLNVRSSLRSVMDYYVVNDLGRVKPLFYIGDNALQYVSLSPMVYSRGTEVFVSLRVEKTEDEAKLTAVECLLTDVLPKKQAEFPIQTPDSCIQVNSGIKAQAITFEIESENGNQNSMSINPLTGQDSNIAQATTEHLLPSVVKIKFINEDDKQEWAFNPKIENLLKYFALDGFRINV